MEYYSITISIICIVDDGKLPKEGYTQDIQVHIVKASGFEEAQLKAVEIGRSEEHEYKNENGNTVYWKFKEIEYIRKLGESITDVEVSTRLEHLPSDEILTSKTNFCPEKSEPLIDDKSHT